MPSGQLTVTPVTMRGLEDSDFAESRTFVGCFVIPNEKHRTRSSNGPEPQWNHPLVCNVPEGYSALQIELVNEDPERAGVIGGARVNLNQVFAEGRTEDWISIVGREYEPIGEIMVVLQFQGSDGEAEGYAGGYSEENKLVAAEGERSMGDEEEEKKIPDWVKYGGMALAGAAAIGLGAYAYHKYKENEEEEEEAEGLEVREKDDDSSSSSSSSSDED
ncbi:hypothetical protein BJV82DRAFT_626713 [Fennellomyces sp. T-0311]|nr:hypothetical protein BJV82DRAFT_626713 [Fennellomyces sp. T-0311]